jgi:hypothetical protein
MNRAEIDIEIQTFIESLLLESQYSTIDYHTYEGVDIDTEPDPQDDTWVKFSVRMLDTSIVEIGRTNALGIRNCMLHVNIYTPKDGGTVAGALLSGNFEDSLRRIATENLSFQEPNTIFVDTDDWFNHHLAIPFYTTIGE